MHQPQIIKHFTRLPEYCKTTSAFKIGEIKYQSENGISENAIKRRDAIQILFSIPVHDL